MAPKLSLAPWNEGPKVRIECAITPSQCSEMQVLREQAECQQKKRAKQRHIVLAVSKSTPITKKKKTIVERKIYREGQKGLSKEKKPPSIEEQVK